MLSCVCLLWLSWSPSSRGLRFWPALAQARCMSPSPQIALRRPSPPPSSALWKPLRPLAQRSCPSQGKRRRKGPHRPPLPQEEGVRQAFDIFWEAWQIVEREYYGELPDPQQVTYGAIRGALQTLGDDYTSFIEPQIAHILREDASGTFEGIGALVRMNE
ncbi:MAG: hypothetical protein C4310_04010, partial [Chloroflexota bacterium]